MADPAAAAPPRPFAPVAWALFQGGRDPYIILCTIYVLAPYIATVVIGDPVKGQETIAGWNKTAAYVAAFTAPILGAIADRTGARKQLLAVATLAMVPAIFALWWAVPGPGGLSLAMIGALIIWAGAWFNYTDVLHNAMLPAQAPPGAIAGVSGMGFAFGNLASVVLLVAVLVCAALPGVVDLPFLPAAPLFGLSAAEHETSRIVAPLTAVWLALLLVPLLLFARDAPRTDVGWLAAARDGVAGVARTIGKLKAMPNVATFLLARMLYVDAKTAMLIIGGVYAAGVNGWGLIEMTAYGVLLSVFAVAGGVLSGPMDRLLGTKNALLAQIFVTLACLVSLTGSGHGRVLFVEVGTAPVWDAPFFRTLPELVYLAVACVVAVSITACYASSRTMMVRLAPRGMEGELFGLYALAGTATAWAGPLLVEHFTRVSQSQQVGFVSISILLAAGFVTLLFVKSPPGEGADARG